MVVLERDGSVLKNVAVVLERKGDHGLRQRRQSRWLGRFLLTVRRSSNGRGKAWNGA